MLDSTTSKVKPSSKTAGHRARNKRQRTEPAMQLDLTAPNESAGILREKAMDASIAREKMLADHEDTHLARFIKVEEEHRAKLARREQELEALYRQRLADLEDYHRRRMDEVMEEKKELREEKKEFREEKKEFQEEKKVIRATPEQFFQS